MSKNKRTALLPRLRFPEFKNTGEWKICALNKLAMRINTRNHDNLITRVLTNSAIDGVVDQSDYFDREVANPKNLENYFVIDKGDYVYNPRISATAPVGPISKNKIGKGVMSPLYTVFRFENHNNEFYEQYFKTTLWHHYLKSVSNTGARYDRMSISSDSFMKMPLPYRSEEEQQKIADCLSSLDDLIAAEGKKLEALKAHKKGLMQKLFPAEGATVPEWRFPEFRDSGEWNLKPIGEKVDLMSGYAFKSEEILEDESGTPLMRGINITEGFVRHNQDIDRFFTGKTEEIEKYRLQINDLVIGMDGSKVGKNSSLITQCDEGALLVQRVARLRAKSTVTIEFIFQHINSSKFHSYVDKINTSSGIPHISAQQIKDFKIRFPAEIEEQQKIADCLTSIDNLIIDQAKKIEALKAHKKGLMQGLFPSIEEVGE